MHSFGRAFLDRQSITQQLPSTVREIGVLRGREELYRHQSPRALESLRQVARIPYDVAWSSIFLAQRRIQR